jgi:hypothetical protein
MNQRDPQSAMSQQNIMTLLDQIDTFEKNLALSAAGLVIGSGSTSKVKIANTVTFLSGGVFKSKTTAEVAFTTTTHDIAANAASTQEAVYLITLASDGTPTITMGAIASGTGNAKLPERPSTGTPIGHVRITVAVGTTKFAANSDALSAGHLTVAYTDVGYYAPRFDAVQ